MYKAFVLILVFLSFGLNSCCGGSSIKEYPIERAGRNQNTPPVASDNPPNTPEFKAEWVYETEKDQMVDKEIKYAQLLSTNEFEFGFPYGGKQRAKLVLRQHPRLGKDIYLEIQKGQFHCRFNGCIVQIRFGDGKAQTFSAVPPEDNRTDTLFIQNYSRFVKELVKVDKVLIEAQFFREGSRMFEFDTTGFAWNPQSKKK